MQTGGYSEAARRAVTAAHDEALRLGRDCVSVNLIVLGIIDADPDGLATRALRAEGIDLAALRRRIAGAEDPRAHASLAGAHVPFCSETREAVDLAGPERERLRHDQVDTGHVLLALISGAESRVAELLAPHGVHPRQVRKRVIRLLG